MNTYLVSVECGPTAKSTLYPSRLQRAMALLPSDLRGELLRTLERYFAETELPGARARGSAP